MSATGITSASAFPVPSVASATMLVVLAAVPVLLIVAPDKDTRSATVPCSDQVTLVPASVMTPGAVGGGEAGAAERGR